MDLNPVSVNVRIHGLNFSRIPMKNTGYKAYTQQQSDLAVQSRDPFICLSVVPPGSERGYDCGSHHAVCAQGRHPRVCDGRRRRSAQRRGGQ